MIKSCRGCGEDFTTNRSARDYCSRECANKCNGETRGKEPPKGKRYSIWSSGGGVQSTAIAALIETGRLTKPDFGVMVDCGYEKSATLDYMHNVTIPRLKAAGVEFHMLDTTKYTNNDLTDGKGHVNIPAFRLKEDGRVSKLHTHCNFTWKVRVTRMWAREQGVAHCENWLGISTDEVQRARASTLKWITLRYPLIELGLNREACIYEIAKAGWPMPSRSSCIFCPQQDKKAWRNLKENYPEDWAVALAVEQRIRQEAPDVFLCRECKPLSEVF